MWKLACDLGSRPKQGLVGDIKISKDPSLETLQRGHKLAPGKVKIVAKLRPCAKYDANISSLLPWPTCSPVLACLSDKEILPNQPCCIHFINSNLSFINWFILLIKSLFRWQKSPCQGLGSIRLRREMRARVTSLILSDKRNLHCVWYDQHTVIKLWSNLWPKEPIE